MVVRWWVPKEFGAREGRVLVGLGRRWWGWEGGGGGGGGVGVVVVVVVGLGLGWWWGWSWGCGVGKGGWGGGSHRKLSPGASAGSMTSLTPSQSAPGT